MIVEYSERAAGELEDIADYYRQVGATRAGERVIEAIVASVERLPDMPFIGRRQSIENVRKLVVPRTAYLVYYLADPKAHEIVVLTIRHAARVQQFRDD